MRGLNWRSVGSLAVVGILAMAVGAQARENKGGKAKGSKTAVQMSELPTAVSDAIAKAADGGTVKRVVKYENKKHAGETLYRARLVKGDERAKVVVDSNGVVVKGPKWHVRKARAGKSAKSQATQ